MTDLKLNYPTIPEEATALNDFIISRNSDFIDLLKFPGYQGGKENLEIARHWLNMSDDRFTNVSDIIECNSANHSLSSILQTLQQEHQSIITEPFTYPAFKSIALQNGFQLFPSNFDSEGLTIEGLERTIEISKSKIIYIQPTIHNPTCAVMPLERRISISELANRKNILIIEDDAYRFLHPNPPLRFLDLIPENTFYIFSLSKPFNPLIKTAYIVFPKYFANSLVNIIRLNSSGHSTLLSSLAAYILDKSILNKIINKKQLLGKKLQENFLPFLSDLSYQTFPTSFHIWLKLPEKIKSTMFIKQLFQLNIIISNGKDFAADNIQEKETFIRIALGAEKDITKIESALIKIRRLIISHN